MIFGKVSIADKTLSTKEEPTFRRHAFNSLLVRVGFRESGCIEGA